MSEKTKWSPAQERAINDTGSNILVSAGAGSGKTAVLTERVYRLLKQNKDISKFLVLTFTEAASMEMKNRIREKLLDDPELSYMASEVEAAHIETFDAFALFIVKKYALELNLSPDITNLDNTILSLERIKYIDDVFSHLYEDNNEVFIEMVAKFCIKDDSPLRTLVESILKVASLKADKKAYLDSFVETYFDEDRLQGLINKQKDYLRKQLNLIDKLAGELQNADDATQIQEFVRPVFEEKTYDGMRERLLERFSFPTKPKSDATDGDLRNAIKALFDNKVSYKATDFGTSEEIISIYMGNKKYAELLVEIAKEVDERCQKFMFEHNSFDFPSIAAMALDLLRREEIRKEMSSFFTYILVDEYQDTSDIQEEVLRLIGKDNVYMVGDVKQSIYKFRNANCKIFQEKYNAYKQGSGGEEIDLNTSYRSRREIVSAVNDVFSRLMNPEFNLIDYSNGHNFGFGLTTYDSLIDDKGHYGLEIYQYAPTKGVSKYETEAKMIALDIINKIDQGYLVYDKNKKELRECSFKDFAILISASTQFDTYRKIFAEHNIPLYVMHDEKILDSDLSYVTKNLLLLFDSIKKDDVESKEFVHAYCSIARSFLVRMSDQDLYTIVDSKLFYHTDIYKKVSEVVELYKDLSNHEILKHLYQKFDLYKKIITIGDYSSNSHKAKVFLDLIESMDKLGFSTLKIVEYFNNLSEHKLEISYASKDAGEDSVTLTTIHKSKGLEYPIVYLPSLDASFNRNDSKLSYTVSDKYGLILPYLGDVKISNIFHHFVKVDESLEDYEEKLRLFYVAVTRARERLILPLPINENEKVIINPGFSTDFKDIIKYSGIINKYSVPYNFRVDKLPKKNKEINKVNVSFKSVSIPSTVIERKRASKQIEGDVNESLLEFGNMVHYLLEVVDYESKDTSFIKSPGLKKIVDRVLSNPLFDEVSNSNMRHEYRFYDERNGVSGAIDCLILREKSIDIVDFKLKNIDDINYIKQLHTYRDYIKTITDKKVNMYLISSITGEVKQVE